MADISKIQLPSGVSYDLKDSTARTTIEELKTSVTGAMHYIGVTTTAISDGATTSPITIDSDSVTPESGDVVIYGNLELVWNGSKWQELGSTGSLKALAFKDSASGSYTPVGTVSQPTFTGTAATLSVSATPAGTISAPTFTGTEATISSSYTPEGTVSAPTTTVELTTTSVNSMSSAGTLPSWTGSVEDEVLTFEWSAGTLPTSTATTVATGVDSATTTAPTFTGTAGTATATYTPAGTVSAPTFTGTKLTATGSYTPTGTVSKPTFTGTAGTVTVS